MADTSPETRLQQEDPPQENPFCPLHFAFDAATKDLYRDTFGTRHHTTGQGWSAGSHGPVETPGKSYIVEGKVKGHIYNDEKGTCAAFYASTDGQTPVPCSDPILVLKELEMHNNIKVGGWGSGMKASDFFQSIGQVCPTGDKDFYDKYKDVRTFTLENKNMRADYLNALVRVVGPLVDGVLRECAGNTKPFVVYWDGDELYDMYGKTFNDYGPLVWAIAASLNRRGRLAALLAVKNARTKWTKAVGSEPEGTPEDTWYREKHGKPREAFATRYFRESKIDEMMKFIGKDDLKPFYCITHSTEKNMHVSRRQDESKYGYFGASVQSAMAQGPNSCAVVVMFGGGDVIYNELTNTNWGGSAASDRFTKGYKLGTKVIALDVRRKAQTERCKVFEQSGEPEDVFKGIRGKMLEVTAPGVFEVVSRAGGQSEQPLTGENADRCSNRCMIL